MAGRRASRISLLVKPVLNYYLRKSSRGATKLLARRLACRSFPASTLTLLRSRKWLQRRGPEGCVEVARGTFRSTRAQLLTLPAPSRFPPLCAPPRTEEGQGGGR
jgi:hypothetical protein